MLVVQGAPVCMYIPLSIAAAMYKKHVQKYKCVLSPRSHARMEMRAGAVYVRMDESLLLTNAVAVYQQTFAKLQVYDLATMPGAMWLV